MSRTLPSNLLSSVLLVLCLYGLRTSATYAQAAPLAPADGGVEAAPEDSAAQDTSADAGTPDAAAQGDETLGDAQAAELPSEPADAAQSEPLAPAVVVLPAPQLEALEPPASEPLAQESTAPSAPALEVTVVGTKLSRTAGSAHIIRSKELERFEYDDPTTVLQSVPGVYVRTEDGMGLRPNIGIRGVNPDRSKKITLLEDGLLFGPAPYSAPAAYYFPLITRMVQVKVIKGPAAISFGPQTVGGAIDFITRPIPSTTSGAADVSLGQYGYGKAHVYAGTSTERLGFLIEGVRLQNNGFKELASGGDTGFIRNEWMVKAQYNFDPTSSVKNELRLKLTYADEVSNESYLGLSLPDLRHNPDLRYDASKLDRMRNHRTSIVLSHVLEPTANLSITTSVYRHDLSRTWRKVNNFRGAALFDVLRDPTNPRYEPYYALLRGQGESSIPGEALLIGPNQRDYISEGVESRLSYSRKTGEVNHRLEVGARYHYDFIERRHSEDAFQLVDGQLYPEGSPTVVTAFNKGSTHAVAFHALYAMSWKGLELTPGLRAELMRFRYQNRLVSNTDRRFEYGLMPGVGAYYAITEQLGVLAGVYRGFSPPPPDNAKNSDPEQSINYEAGARYTDGPLRLEAIGFYNDYQNLTNVCTFSSGCSQQGLDQQTDAGQARIYGVEVFGQHAIPAGVVKLPLTVSYTFTQTEFLESFRSSDPVFGDVTRGDEMPYVPKHQARAGFGVDHERASAAANFTYVSRMREEPGEGSILRGLHTDRQYWFDLTGQVRLWKTLQLYANIQNLLNDRFVVSRRPFGARPNAPRWFHVGLKASF